MSKKIAKMPGIKDAQTFMINGKSKKWKYISSINNII